MSNSTKNPVPQGKYSPATRYGELIYTAGMTPRIDGVAMMVGKVLVSQPIESYKAVVLQSVKNALTAARNLINENESIAKVLTMTVYVNAEQGFTAHTQLADFASNYLYEELGESGISSRAAIGVATLPSDAPVEIQLVVAVNG